MCWKKWREIRRKINEFAICFHSIYRFANFDVLYAIWFGFAIQVRVFMSWWRSDIFFFSSISFSLTSYIFYPHKRMPRLWSEWIHTWMQRSASTLVSFTQQQQKKNRNERTQKPIHRNESPTSESEFELPYRAVTRLLNHLYSTQMAIQFHEMIQMFS